MAFIRVIATGEHLAHRFDTGAFLVVGFTTVHGVTAHVCGQGRPDEICTLRRHGQMSRLTRTARGMCSHRIRNEMWWIMAGDAGVTTVTEEFTVDELGRIRRLVHRAATVIGLGAAVVENLVTAVNEIITNAIRYAGGRGRVTIRTCPRGIAVDISDHGPGIPDGLTDDRAAIDATSGRGLWMARRLCHYMTINTGPNGATISLAAVLPA